MYLTVYWFDPLVWLAAVLARGLQAGAATRTRSALGADERAAYGKTLLTPRACDKPPEPLLGATTMTSGKGLGRIRTHRGEPAGQDAAVFAVVTLAALLCAVSFTGAPDTTPEVTQEWYDAGFTTEDCAGLSRIPRLGGGA